MSQSNGVNTSQIAACNTVSHSMTIVGAVPRNTQKGSHKKSTCARLWKTVQPTGTRDRQQLISTLPLGTNVPQRSANHSCLFTHKHYALRSPMGKPARCSWPSRAPPPQISATLRDPCNDRCSTSLFDFTRKAAPGASGEVN